MLRPVSLNFTSGNQFERWVLDVARCAGSRDLNSSLNTTFGIIGRDGVDRRDIDETVDAELAELPADMRARLVRILS
jgi:hypothetical protein